MIQTKQNQNYDFHQKGCFETVEEARKNQSAMVEKTIAMVEAAGKKGCDLVVTPEAINFPGLKRFHGGDLEDLVPDMSDVLWERLGSLAKKGSFWLAAGAFLKRQKMDGTYGCYNSAVIFDAEGKIVSVYDKIHTGRDEGIESGDHYLVFAMPEGNVGICICWDIQFPETARELALRGADLIIVPTWGWESLYSTARAYENGIFVAAAMGVPYKKPIDGVRTPSQVIGPDGRILATGPADGDAVIICDIELRETKKYKELRMGDRRPDTYTMIGARW
ncbi:carbon-nitrogen hydrolase family protein [Clostridium sp. MCC353]|uniref:carbon-nitrogen hydrolase family protein n=1 Tax=Clostridium sp. MCC353 TaxID=2592646 RepID=UPI001C019409|nr:carbon-nitrogen hydrolase family protein [Clostridium sp. MCC353]